MCPMNCHPTLCGMHVALADNNSIEVTPDQESPDSQGFLCSRGFAAAELYRNPQRIVTPLSRGSRSESFSTTDWNSAYESILSSTTNPERMAIWAGHGVFTNNYGSRFATQLLARFANHHGSLFWEPPIICWGLGAMGLAITGVTETVPKKEIEKNSDLILLWGADFSSQPTTARHVLNAQKRGAKLVSIDVRRTSASAKCDHEYLIKPGTDTQLALGLIHTLIQTKQIDHQFIANYTVGFDQLAKHVQEFTPAWAARETGISEQQLLDLAGLYGRAKSSAILLGGSSMHKGQNSWYASRAISCLPAITGNLSRPGAGLGPRHGGWPGGRALNTIADNERFAWSNRSSNQMDDLVQKMYEGEIDTLLLFGSNIVSSFADTNKLIQGLKRVPLIVSYDLFLNSGIRQFSDIVLPGTTWIEEVGCKGTEEHLILTEQLVQPEGESRSLFRVLTELADKFNLSDFSPWSSTEEMINAVIQRPKKENITIESLRKNKGIQKLEIEPVAHASKIFPTPSGKIEFLSEKALRSGLPELPTPPAEISKVKQKIKHHSIELTFGRELHNFHGFYDNGQALPRLKAKNAEPELHLSVNDANDKAINSGDRIRAFNDHGEFFAIAKISNDLPAGTAWVRDGWNNLNNLTSIERTLPTKALKDFNLAAGQSSFRATIDIERLNNL